MKTYDVITEHTARFVYRIRAESEDAAGAAAMELMDYEICRADVGDINYEGDVAEIQDEDPNHTIQVVHCAETIAEAARKDDDENGYERRRVGALWEEAYG